MEHRRVGALPSAHEQRSAHEKREALELIRTIAGTPTRQLGDEVSMRTAWRIAADLGLEDPVLAAFPAVTRFQADSFVALDPALLRLAEGVVPVAPQGALRS